MRGTRPAFFADPGAGSQQTLVTERFHTRAWVWEDLYERNDLISVIVRHRHNQALAWIDGLRLQPGSPALEIGPGAGMMMTALTERRFLVTGADTAPGMIEIARRRAASISSSPTGRLSTQVGGYCSASGQPSVRSPGVSAALVSCSGQGQPLSRVRSIPVSWFSSSIFSTLADSR